MNFQGNPRAKHAGSPASATDEKLQFFPRSSRLFIFLLIRIVVLSAVHGFGQPEHYFRLDAGILPGESPPCVNRSFIVSPENCNFRDSLLCKSQQDYEQKSAGLRAKVSGTTD